MNAEFVIVTLLVGLGTWLLRFLPTWLVRGTGDPGAPLSRFLAATGPAAIAALYVGSVLPGLAPQASVLVPFLAGSLAVIAGYVWRRDITVATLAGAAAYGVVFALM